MWAIRVRRSSGCRWRRDLPVAYSSISISAFNGMRYPIPGIGGFNYVTLDISSRRYVSHATHMGVLDVDNGKVVGVIVAAPAQLANVSIVLTRRYSNMATASN